MDGVKRSLLFSTKSPGVAGAHSSTLAGWKAELTLKPPSGFEPEIPQMGIQHLNH